MTGKPGKRCVLLIVDALSVEIVKSMIEMGRLPNLGRLVDSGGRLDPCLSIFPSITPAATCSIVTGKYPRDHGIEGACWFDRDQQEIAYFGDDVRLAFARGLYDYLVDFGDRLNFERLSAPTLFEQLAAAEIESTSINSMWFAGPDQHVRTTPLALKLGVGKLPETVRGPKFLKLGSFVESLPPGVPAQSKPSIINRYGFQDQVTIDCLLAIARHDALTPMTVGYFPENDDQAHDQGLRSAAETTVTRFDQFLGEFVELVGGWDAIGQSIELIIVGDHSQVEFPEGGPRVMRLDECLSQFQQAEVGTGWADGDELFICPNMRAAAIYLRNSDDEILRQRVIDTLKRSPLVDQVIFETSDTRFCVETSDRGRLEFERCEKSAGGGVSDSYGQNWKLSGSPEVLDLSIDSDDQICDGEYPNSLERIANSFVPGAKPIWITARTDTEFACEGFSTHDGGSHGALHRVDSMSALITSSGVNTDELPNAERPRIIDVAGLCKQALGVLMQD